MPLLLVEGVPEHAPVPEPHVSVLPARVLGHVALGHEVFGDAGRRRTDAHTRDVGDAYLGKLEIEPALAGPHPRREAESAVGPPAGELQTAHVANAHRPDRG